MWFSCFSAGVGSIDQRDLALLDTHLVAIEIIGFMEAYRRSFSVLALRPVVRARWTVMKLETSVLAERKREMLFFWSN